MSGHSKWSQIKHKKAATDAKKANVYAKVVRLIVLSVREKGKDPETNAALRAAIQKAREVNMPQDNIERAIQKGAGGSDGTVLQECTYEVYGPGGVALIITGITDNNNRTSNELKHIISEHGGKWANPGSVLWAFTQQGSEWAPQEYSLVSISPADEEKLLALMDAIDEHGDVQEITANIKEN